MSDDFNEDEFKIVESNQKKKPSVEDKLAKTQAVLVKLITKMVLRKGEDLDVNNIFNIESPLGNTVCILSDSLPCKNPNCMSCNMVHFHEETAGDVLYAVSRCMAKRVLKVCHEEMSAKKRELVEGLFNDLIDKIEGNKNE